MSESNPVQEAAEAPTLADADLRGLLDGDAARLAGLLRARAGDRSARGEARTQLALAFGLAADAEADRAALLAGLTELSHSLAALGDRGSATVRPLREVQVRTPLPDRVLRPRSAWLVDTLSARISERFDPPMALSEERIAWMEARCSQPAPGLLKPMRQNPGEGDKLVGSEFELLRKRGRSPFS
ncbi:MAG: hypothetical protein RIT45_1092 [Pseudomonadota bacterium]|jgi:hypothetical protein